MATYVVGDIQGCFDGLIRLLDQLSFRWDKDKLWVCGDLVNRGSQSTNTLRYLYEFRDRVQIVLGNHDLHLIAVANGCAQPKAKDTIHEILLPENADLVKWLEAQPLAAFHKKTQTLMVHAGVPPQWTLKQTLKCSEEMQQVLADNDRKLAFLQNMYGNLPDQWSKKLTGNDRYRYITNALTRMRFCTPDGRLDMVTKTPPGKQPNHLVPWFSLPLKLDKSVRVVFGHWAALNGQLATERFQALDTGYVWGGKLTAMNIKTGERFSVSA